MTLIDFINKKLEINVKKINLFEQALTHRSFLNESKNKELSSYERLEFLGDSVLSFFISQKIYNDYPRISEGDLTNLRSSVVKAETLSQIAKKIELNEWLKLSKGEEDGGGKNNSSILADCLEAIIAATFLDQGIEVTKKTIEKLFAEEITIAYGKKTLKDYKSLLQEISQKEKGISPLYKVIKEEGPDHNKTFTVMVCLAEKNFEIGTGRSKQEAEQNSARKTLEKWHK